MKTFGEQLRQYRLRRKMTQQEIADRLGLSSPYIAQMESGFKPPPPQSLVDRITVVLQIHPEERQTFTDAAEKERELQSLVKATRKIGYILAGNKVCVPQKSVSYRVQQEVDDLIDLIPKEKRFSLDAYAANQPRNPNEEIQFLKSLDDLKTWTLNELGDRPQVWLAFLGQLYEVLILTPDERLLCRQPSDKRTQLQNASKEVGVFFRQLQMLLSKVKTQAEEQGLPDVIAPHEAWRDIDQALGAPGGVQEMIPNRGQQNGSIRSIPIKAEIPKGTEEFEEQAGLGSFGLPRDWFLEDQEYEACLVHTDAYMSMGIWPGCKLVYELSSRPHDDDIVIVQLGDRRCIRKYFDQGEEMLLQGSPVSRPIQVAKSEESVQIVGIVRELISRFRDMQS